MRLILSILATAALLILLNRPVASGFALGPVLEPLEGFYRTAALADRPGEEQIEIEALIGDVRIIRDERGVPHIFAGNDRDALIALGYATARDRLFEMDFVARAASGTLAEVLGPDALVTDRFFRQLGARWAIERNAAWLRDKGGEQAEMIAWYQAGANAWIEALRRRDHPFEFRILGYRPRPLRMEDALAVLMYMSYDLSYTERDFAYAYLEDHLTADEYELLFPRHLDLAVPITGSDEAVRMPLQRFISGSPDTSNRAATRLRESLPRADVAHRSGLGDLAEGLIPGKGSNNWAVDGSRSTSGHPILAGDMHLNLSLPSIWYEAHIVTPEMNVYGVTIPGAPVIIEGITPETAWAFTNTGADQIDFYALELTEDRSGYVVDGRVLAFDTHIDTIVVARSEPVLDTLRLSRYGPVRFDDNGATAVRWTAHDTSRTMLAIWKMGRAGDYAAFSEATRLWDAPMQNILFAAVDGVIAIRSTGYLPVRAGDSGAAVVDGSTEANDWIGRVPFEELPAVERPGIGFVTSTNQPPAGPAYPHYLGHDWRDAYRSLRIDELLRGRERHSVEDFMAYQADVHAVQAELFRPLLEAMNGLVGPAEEARRMLVAWNGETRVDRVEPFVLDRFLTALAELAWDEEVFRRGRAPNETTLVRLLKDDPNAMWFDVVETPALETGWDILETALADAAGARASTASGRPVVWGDEHRLVIRHITRSPALKALWRGPYPYPGFSHTLSPAGSMQTTHSASWRVVVDLSETPPRAFGVYPGGQSGNPFSIRYDDQIDTYLGFDYYRLLMPSTPDVLSPDEISGETRLSPSAGG